jgi:pilus assembly protein Flp/PilA
MFSFLSPSNFKRGQGLVEYAIILALVGIVVIAVMRVMGPKIGNVFSTINNSLSASLGSGSGTFVHIANEGETFTVPTGQHEVQYGSNGIYFTQFVNGPTTIQCSAGTFGDPNSGGVNSCSMR